MDDPKTPLRRARDRRDLTIAQVAAAVSLDPGNLSRIERGIQVPSPKVAAALASFFGDIDEMQIFYPDRFVETPPEADPVAEAQAAVAGQGS